MMVLIERLRFNRGASSGTLASAVFNGSDGISADPVGGLSAIVGASTGVVLSVSHNRGDFRFVSADLLDDLSSEADAVPADECSAFLLFIFPVAVVVVVVFVERRNDSVRKNDFLLFFVF